MYYFKIVLMPIMILLLCLMMAVKISSDNTFFFIRFQFIRFISISIILYDKELVSVDSSKILGFFPKTGDEQEIR